MLRIKLIWTTQTIFKHTSLLLLDVRHSTLWHSCLHKKHANLRTIFQTCNYHSHTHIVSTPRTLLSHLTLIPRLTSHHHPTTHHNNNPNHLFITTLTQTIKQVTTTHPNTLLYRVPTSYVPTPNVIHTHPRSMNRAHYAQNQVSFPPLNSKGRSLHVAR